MLQFSRKDPNVRLEADGGLKQKDCLKNVQVNHINNLKNAQADDSVQVASIRSISTDIHKYKTKQSTKQLKREE